MTAAPVAHTAPPPVGTPRQRTVANPAVISGKGLMLGREATLTILPAPPDHGVVFERVDIARPTVIPALVTNVVPNPRRTTLRSGEVSIETVEHCLSALAGLGINNALLRLHGPELPCGDGSAMPFVEPIRAAGIAEQDAPRRTFKVTQPIVIQDGDATIAALPASSPLGPRVLYELDYGSHSNRIPRQAFGFDPATDDYAAEIAPSRTFSLKEEAEALWSAGLCRHLTPRDVLVIGPDGPIQNAYRFDNEPVRHKILDVIGDLSLVGATIECQIVANKSGHGLNRQLGTQIRRMLLRTQQERALVEGRAMDARAIGRLMPHRFPMLLVDRVLEIDSNRRAVGVKNVSINEPFFQGHYPGTPIMPGVLIVEAMAQMGGLLLSQTLEHTGKVAVLLSLDKVKLRKAVTPGDQLVIEVETMRATTRGAAVRAKALVGDKVAAEAEIRFMMVDQDFE